MISVSKYNLLTLLLSFSGSQLLAESKKPSCPSAQKAKAEVLISKGDKSIFNSDDFDDFLSELKDSDQRIGMMIEIQPEQILKDVLDSKERSFIIGEWAKENKIRESEAYKEKKAKLINHIHEMLDGEIFMEKHPVKIAESEVRDYYNKNKEQMVSRMGGVEAYGISFKDESKAKEFLDKVEKTVSKDIAKVAQQEKIESDMEEFGVINKNSYSVDDAIKNVIMEITKFPTCKLVKVENKDSVSYWVIQAKDKHDTEYMPFEEVSERIEQMLKPTKVKEKLDEILPKYAKEYGIKKNDEAFNKILNKHKSSAQQKFAAMQGADQR